MSSEIYYRCSCVYEYVYNNKYELGKSYFGRILIKSKYIDEKLSFALFWRITWTGHLKTIFPCCEDSLGSWRPWYFVVLINTFHLHKQSFTIVLLMKQNRLYLPHYINIISWWNKFQKFSSRYSVWHVFWFEYNINWMRILFISPWFESITYRSRYM